MKSIEPARPEHWPHIRRICVATSYTPVGDPEAFADKWVGPYQKEPRHVYVALVDGEVAGYLTGSATTTPPYPPGYPAHLHVNVDPAHQGRGLGRALVERFLAEVGAAGVHLTCREEPVAFYESLGFKTLARLPAGLYVMGRAL